MNKRRKIRWGVRLGVLALALNALVPIHIAFDIASAFDAPRPERMHGGADDGEWPVLALLAGHDSAAGKCDTPGNSHGSTCPVCSALGILAGFAPAAVAVLPIPVLAAAPPVLVESIGAPSGILVVYRSRAPPVA